MEKISNRFGFNKQLTLSTILMDGEGFEPFWFQQTVDSFYYPNGWRRIRTFEGVANRFTVCPLWPLGNPSIIYGTYRARTYDPLLVRQMLSQLS